MIQDISFIVIARNESFAIEKCLASIASMPLSECEVICVDSDSTDNTLDVMKGYIGRIENLTIVQCSGYLNASVGRNAGLRYAKRRYIFFVDGDHELYPDFIAEAVELMKSGKADAVTGGREEIVYSSGYRRAIKTSSYRSYPRVTEITTCGGWFMITRKEAERVGPWNELFTINEDFEYVLRFSMHGRFLALPATMCTHHTLAYNNRGWERLAKRYPMYLGMLIRKNINRPKAVLLLLRESYSAFVGLVMCLLLLAGILLTSILSLSIYFIFFAVSLLMISDLVWGAVRKQNVLRRFLRHYLYGPMIIAGIFFDLNRNVATTTVERIC